MQRIFYFIFFQVIVLNVFASPYELWEEAVFYYKKGEESTVYQVQLESFNRSLFLFNQLQILKFPKGPLFQAIANTYFQLGQYSFALLYYEKALKQGMASSAIENDVRLAQEKLGLPLNDLGKNQSFFSFLNAHDFSFFLYFMSFLLFSLAIWVKTKALKQTAMLSGFLLLILLAIPLLNYYHEPLEGIIIKNTSLSLSPGQNTPQLTLQPIKEGSKVRILSIDSKGDWVKILHSENLIGYILTKNLRPI